MRSSLFVHRLRLAAGVSLTALLLPLAASAACPNPAANTFVGTISPFPLSYGGAPVAVEIGDGTGNVAAEFQGLLSFSDTGGTDFTFATTTPPSVFNGAGGILVEQSPSSTCAVNLTGMNATMSLTGGNGIEIQADTTGATTISTVTTGTISTPSGVGILYRNVNAAPGDATITVGAAIATGASGIGVQVVTQGPSTNTVSLAANVQGAVRFEGSGVETARLSIADGVTLSPGDATQATVAILDQRNATISNAGTIVGGATAVSTNSNATLTNLASGVIDGTGYAFRQTGAGRQLTVDNAGLIAGAGANVAGSTVAIANSGVWRPNRDSAFSGTASLANTGSFNAGSWRTALTSVDNAGRVEIATGGTLAASSGYRQTAGATIVNGSLVTPALTLDGGVLSGTGSVIGNVAANAGSTVSPGTSPGTLTIRGNLSFAAGSTYLAEVQGATADRLDVSGTASLAGTLRLVPLGGSYSFDNPYTLLSAAGGRSGTFATVDSTGSFGDGVATVVSYTGSEVLLTLRPRQIISVLAPDAQSANGLAIAAAIDAAAARGLDVSGLFPIYNLPAAAIPGALRQLTGEVHTASAAVTEISSDRFLGAMLDPMAAGRLDDGGPGPGMASFSGTVSKGADMPAAPARLDAPRYAVWGSASGSTGRTDGDAAAGSARRRIEDAHIATGVDIRLMPGTIAGIAVSAGRAHASMPGGLGRAEADIYQVGLYGSTKLGPLKLAASGSYAVLDTDVRRAIPALGTAVTSSYQATAWSGRLQANLAALEWNGISLSPLAAVQATRSRTPAIVETNWTGVTVGALTLARRSDVTSRGELGLQLDARTTLFGIGVTGYVRGAWAHYFQRGEALSASLIALPGTAFSTRGATMARNSALVSTGISARLTESVTLGLNLDGEFAARSNRLGGTAQLRVAF